MMAVILGKNTCVISYQSFGQKSNLFSLKSKQPAISFGGPPFHAPVLPVFLGKTCLSLSFREAFVLKSTGDWGAMDALLICMTTVYSVAIEYCSILCCCAVVLLCFVLFKHLIQFFWASRGLYSEAWVFSIKNLGGGTVITTSSFYYLEMFLRQCCLVLAHRKTILNNFIGWLLQKNKDISVPPERTYKILR